MFNKAELYLVGFNKGALVIKDSTSSVLPYLLSKALEDTNLELLELQEQILDLAESMPDYVARVPSTISEESH